MQACTYVCVYVYVYICVCLCVCIHVPMYVCMNVSIRQTWHEFMCVRVCIVWVFFEYVIVCMFVCMRRHTYFEMAQIVSCQYKESFTRDSFDFTVFFFGVISPCV